MMNKLMRKAIGVIAGVVMTASLIPTTALAGSLSGLNTGLTLATPNDVTGNDVTSNDPNQNSSESTENGGSTTTTYYIYVGNDAVELVNGTAVIDGSKVWASLLTRDTDPNSWNANYGVFDGTLTISGLSAGTTIGSVVAECFTDEAAAGNQLLLPGRTVCEADLYTVQSSDDNYPDTLTVSVQGTFENSVSIDQTLVLLLNSGTDEQGQSFYNYYTPRDQSNWTLAGAATVGSDGTAVINGSVIYTWVYSQENTTGGVGYHPEGSVTVSGLPEGTEIAQDCTVSIYKAGYCKDNYPYYKATVLPGQYDYYVGFTVNGMDDSTWATMPFTVTATLAITDREGVRHEKEVTVGKGRYTDQSGETYYRYTTTQNYDRSIWEYVEYNANDEEVQQAIKEDAKKASHTEITTASGEVLKSELKGSYYYEPGLAVLEGDNSICNDKDNYTVYTSEVNASASPAAYASIVGFAGAGGFKVLSATTLNITDLANNPFCAYSSWFDSAENNEITGTAKTFTFSDGSVLTTDKVATVKAGLPEGTTGKVMVVGVTKGGAAFVQFDQDDDPNTVTFDALVGDGVYGFIVAE